MLRKIILLLLYNRYSRNLYQIITILLENLLLISKDTYYESQKLYAAVVREELE